MPYYRAVAPAAAPTPERPDTWINEEIRRLYRSLFDTGHAHTVEAYEDGALVGGLYGVSLGAAFFGESMFHQLKWPTVARSASPVGEAPRNT